MSDTQANIEKMFEADLARAKPVGAAKADEIDEFDVRLAYLDGIARAYDRHFPPLKDGTTP